MSARLLIIDDDQDIRVFLSIALSAAGYEVSACARLPLPAEAPTPDLALVDLLDQGAPLKASALAALVARGCPVLLISGLQPDDPRVRAALSQGAVGFLQKPFTLDLLRARVEAALKGR
ncbi:response regulator [Myxococcota bacterium]|nr:response regulator [Myxococcota bacterium]MBU1429595.1 response regulator [Myxococcota bacterium]MBU1899987.1 response regulator [Myxococcota bacterium]